MHIISKHGAALPDQRVPAEDVCVHARVVVASLRNKCRSHAGILQVVGFLDLIRPIYIDEHKIGRKLALGEIERPHGRR